MATQMEREEVGPRTGADERASPDTPPSARNARRAAQEAAENTIQASRRPRKNRLRTSTSTERAEEVIRPAAAAAASSRRGESDPWTVPQSVRDRFVQDGNRFYFPDGAEAFKDRGRRLTTPSENTVVVQSLIEIARSRGWTEVRVGGTERFRQAAWHQARLAGIDVRGYQPSDEERIQLIRALGRELPRSHERGDGKPAGEPERAQYSARAESSDNSPTPQTPPRSSRERIAGKLLEHGRDTYKHDPEGDPSYFVRIETREGTREIWGRDIERAVAKSFTQPQAGDEVILERNGKDAVTVRRKERYPDGRTREKPIDVYRNRWVIEKRQFFEERAAAADALRDESISAREAVRTRPELAGAYLNLRAAELAARRLQEPEDQRRFVAHVREKVADRIAQGATLRPARLRERVPRTADPRNPRRRGPDDLSATR